MTLTSYLYIYSSIMLQFQKSMWSWKTLVCAGLVAAVLLVLTVSSVTNMVSENCFHRGANSEIYLQRGVNFESDVNLNNNDQTASPRMQAPTMAREFFNNSGAACEYKAWCSCRSFLGLVFL